MTEAIKKWVKSNSSSFKSESEKEHLIDFLKDQFSHKNSINFSYDQCVQKAHQWVEDLNSKKYLTNPGLTETIMEFDQGFKIVRLLDQPSKNWEGRHMSHCVSSTTYSTHEQIYSLRDSKNKPHCTLEIKDKAITQIKGKSNGPVNLKYIDYVLTFLESIEVPVSGNDLENLGYFSLENTGSKQIRKYFPTIIIKKIKNINYCYINSVVVSSVSITDLPLTPSKIDQAMKEFRQKIHKAKNFKSLITSIITTLPTLITLFIRRSLGFDNSIYDLLPLIKKGANIDLCEHFLSREENISFTKDEQFFPNLFQQNETRALAIYKKTEKYIYYSTKVSFNILKYLIRQNKLELALDMLKYIFIESNNRGVDFELMSFLCQPNILEVDKILIRFLLENKNNPVFKQISTIHSLNNHICDRFFRRSVSNEYFKDLLSNTISLDPTFKADSLLTFYCEQKKLSIVKMLVEEFGSDVQYMNNLALKTATSTLEGFQSGMVQYLLEKGADLTDQYGSIYLSALHQDWMKQEWKELLTSKFNEQNKKVVDEFLSSADSRKEFVEKNYVITKKISS